MQINTNYSAGWVPTLAYAKAAATPRDPAAGPAFTAKEQLDASLAQTPDSRPEQVARAARLLQAEDYPNTAQIQSLARHLAEVLDPRAAASDS